LEHRTLRIGEDFLSEYGHFVDKTVYATDGTAGSLWSHEIYLSAQAKQLAPVRLTGNFGSEVLRGVSTFKKFPLSRDMIAAEFHPRIDGLADVEVTDAGNSAVTFAAFREIPWNLHGIMASAKSQLTFRTPYLDNDVVALTYRAPSDVRQSSASALSLVRDCHPALSSIATDRAVVHDGSGPAYALRRLAAELTFKLDYMHKEAPPSGSAWFLGALDRMGMLGLHKWLPYRLWFRDELANHVVDALSDPATSRLPFWNQRSLPRIARDHISGTKNYVREINAALTLGAVDRLLLRGH
jgi:asparagine synthase (glutamine-hydrolysing)